MLLTPPDRRVAAVHRAVLVDPADVCARHAFADLVEETSAGVEWSELVRASLALDEVTTKCTCRRADPRDLCAACDEPWGAASNRMKDAFYVVDQPANSVLPGWAIFTPPSGFGRLYGLDQMILRWNGPVEKDAMPVAWIRGGFVDEIRLPASLFLQEAAGLFGTWPITRVELSDVPPTSIGPTVVRNVTLWGYGGPENSTFDPSARLPAALWGLWMTGYDGGHPAHLVHGWYPCKTKVAAVARLSTLLVNYGRHLAGLEALP